MNISILGSCANQISNREGVSILVENKDDNLLIDCGPGIVAAFGRSYRKTSEVNNVLLTHVHGDHISGFAYFVWNRNFECMSTNNHAKDLHVYGAEDTIAFAKFTLAHSYPELKFPFEVFFHELKENECFSCGTLTVQTLEAIHTVPCLACVVECDNKKVVYSCDTLSNENLLRLSNNADILIHEGMMVEEMEQLALKVKHSLSREAGSFAKAANAKQLVLVHVAPVLLGRESLLIKEAQTEYEGPISVPFDGTVYGV